MQRLLTRTFAPMLLLMLGLLALAAPAHAADGWLPNYQKGTNVYVDPQLQNDAVRPVTLDPKLEADLDSDKREHGVEYIFVFSKLGTDANAIPPQYNGNYSAWRGDELVARWSGNPDFPAGKAVVIVLVRGANNPNSFSFGANASSQLKQYGVTREWYTATLTGIRNQYLPNDVAGYARAVARATNEQISASIAATEQARLDEERRQAEAAANAAWWATFWSVWFPIICVVVVLLLVFAYFFFTWRSAKGALAARINGAFKENLTLAKAIDNSNANYLQLQGEYLDFLTDKKGRAAKFTFETKEQYEAALANYSEYSVRRELINKRFEAALAVLAAAGWFGFGAGKLRKALASISTDAIVVTGKEVALKDVTSAFGGTVQETTYPNFDALMDNIDVLFTRTNTALAGIVAAFEGAEQNKQDIERLLGEITTLQTTLTENGLRFDPYDKDYQGFKGEADTTLADIASNPVGKFAASERIETGVEALKARINRAVALKKALATTATTIAGAKARVAEVRGMQVAFAYPLTEKEPRPQFVADAKFTLVEDKSAPDVILSEANEHYDTAQAHVLAGELDEADASKAAAEKSAQSARDTVQAVLDAKKFVEKNVPPVRANLATLEKELPGAKEAVAALRADFLAVNFTGEPEKVTSAQSVFDATEGQLAAVRTAYFEQRFVAARALLEDVSGDVQGSRDGLVQVHTRLKTLRDLRAHAKATVTEAETLSKRLDTKRRELNFTTSAATDQKHETQKPKLVTQRADVDKDVTDWPAAATAADTVLAALKAVDAAIDTERQAHALAETRVGDVEAAVQAAATACNHDDVRQKALDELANARRVLKTLQTTLGTAKSDWNALARSAAEQKSVANNASTLAATDKTLATEAREEYRQAKAKIEQVEGRSYAERKSIGGSTSTFGSNVNADTSDADTAYRLAGTALREKRWEDAKKHAQSAKTKAEAAETKAEEATAALIAAAVLAYNQEQERIRKEKEREEQEERDRKAREARNNAPRIEIGNTGGGNDGPSVTGNTGGGQDRDFS
jgi:hypothetical protein